MDWLACYWILLVVSFIRFTSWFGPFRRHVNQIPPPLNFSSLQLLAIYRRNLLCLPHSSPLFGFDVISEWSESNSSQTSSIYRTLLVQSRMQLRYFFYNYYISFSKKCNVFCMTKISVLNLIIVVFSTNFDWVFHLKNGHFISATAQFST